MSDSLRSLHTAGAWVVVVANGTAGLWALAAVRWEHVRVRALWLFTAAAQVAMFVQVVAGVAMVGRGTEADQFHMFYGFLALVAIAILYSYRLQLRHRIHLLYGLGGLFITGLALRAMLLDA